MADAVTMADSPAQTPVLVVTGGEIVERGFRRHADITVVDGLIVSVDPPGRALRSAAEMSTEGELRELRATSANSDDAVVFLDAGEFSTVVGAVEEIDASGCVIAAGFVDLCARVAEPQCVDGDVVQITAVSAALGGFTALVALPDTEPPLDGLGQLAELRRLTESAPHCHIVPAGTITAGRAGTRLAPMAELASVGVGWFTDTGPQPDWALLCRALQYAAPLGAVVAVRPSGSSLGVGAAMHEGAVSARMGVAGEPAEAEHAAVAAALGAVRRTGGRLHLDRISAAASVELVRDAKAEGLDVSASVTADHLVFVDADAACFDTLMRAEPPFRTSADRAALVLGVNDRTVDAVVSAHTPLAPHDKDLPFDEAPPGFASLETSAAIVLSNPDIELEAALDALSWRPAELAGISHLGGGSIRAGQPANLVVIDLDRPWAQTTRGKSFARVSPHLDRRLNAQVIETMVGGARAVSSGWPQDPDGLARDRCSHRVHSRWRRWMQPPRRGDTP